jgi:hypothetical protein
MSIDRKKLKSRHALHGLIGNAPDFNRSDSHHQDPVTGDSEGDNPHFRVGHKAFAVSRRAAAAKAGKGGGGGKGGKK